MSQSQYIKYLERELNKLNKIIDQKIVKGEDYRKHARDHKLILKKIAYHTRSRRNIFSKFFHPTFQF